MSLYDIWTEAQSKYLYIKKKCILILKMTELKQNLQKVNSA